MLQEDLPGKTSKFTGEHGFLYIIKHLVQNNLEVEAIKIAKTIKLRYEISKKSMPTRLKKV